jgi:hypothetical protein
VIRKSGHVTQNFCSHLLLVSLPLVLIEKYIVQLSLIPFISATSLVF